MAENDAAPDLRNNENDPRRLDRAPVGQNAAFDPEVQKAQGYLRALGIEEVEVDGQKQSLKVDGKIGPTTHAALTKYRTENGIDNNESFSGVLKHMEDRISKNPGQIQQFVSETNADGKMANPFNVMAMQLVMNLLAPIIKALSGGKMDMEKLKIDGVNGPRTQNALVAYDTQSPKMAPAPQGNTPASPALKVDGAAPAAPIAPAATAENPAAGPASPASESPAGAAASGPTAQEDPLGVFIQQKEAEFDAREATRAAIPARPEPVQVRPAEPAYDNSRAPTRRERYESNMGMRSGGALTQNGLRGDFRAATGLEGVHDNLRMRQELRDMGYAPKVASELVKQHRTDELIAGGMNQRQAVSAISRESTLADRQERWMETSSRQAYAQDARYERQRNAAYERGIAQDRRDYSSIGSGIGQMAGMRGGEAGHVGRAMGGLVGIFGRVSANNDSYGAASMNERQTRQLGTDLGNVVRSGAVLSGQSSAVGNGAFRAIQGITNVVGRMGIFNGDPPGRVVTYPPPSQRQGYTPQTIDQRGMLDRSNQVSPVMARAASDGVTPEQRQQIIADYERQKQAPATAPETTAVNNTRQYNDQYAPV